MWVPRHAFHKQKSYGCFWCYQCGNTWVSSHAFRHFRQACLLCNTFCLPMYMWLNALSKKQQPQRAGGAAVAPPLPHSPLACEACASGLCKSAEDTKRLRRRRRGAYVYGCADPAPYAPRDSSAAPGDAGPAFRAAHGGACVAAVQASPAAAVKT